MDTTKGTIIIGVLKTSGKSLSKIFPSPFGVLLVCFLFSIQIKAQLVINEVSQGASGNKEYVELVVVGTPTCTTIPCVDLRGFIIDDNNGTFATGAGTGIANGCIKLTNDALWSCVPAGTIILIYNDADLNPLVPVQDLSLTDGNCLLVIPISNCTLFDKNTVQPAVGTSTYPTTGFAACGNWGEISMANSDDSFQTRDAAGTLIHAVSWGNNTLANIIYFASSSAGDVAFMTNGTDNNPSNQANWVKLGITGNETPGAPNNAANASWINSMNNNCNTILPLTLSFSTTQTACGCTGSATVTASGAVGPYTYTWSPSAVTVDNIGSLCVGNYPVSVRSANGCLVTDSVRVTSTVTLTTIMTATNVSCNGNADGHANVSVSGSPGPFTYTWSAVGGSAAMTTNLPPGIYTVNVADAAGCTTLDSISITEPPVLTAAVTEADITCFGVNNGTATVTANGGTGAYTYSWMPSGGTGSTTSGLSPNTYTATVTDANGCIATASALVSEPSILALTISSTSVTCNGLSNGTTSINATGGTGAYSYTWAPSGGNSSSATGLSFGNYTVNVSDANGCVATASVVVNQPNAITTTITTTDALCFGANGSATVTASGGTGAYTYSWTPVGGTLPTATLPQGNYSVTATDANNCSVTTSTTINQPVVLTATVTETDITCFGANDGTATVTANGGTGVYTYSWAPIGGTNSTANGLSQNTYTATVTDANGCSVSASALVSEPSIITLTVSNTSVTCNGLSNGTASVNATGGTGAYTYTWSPSGGNSANANGLAFGNYTVTVQDANGCIMTASTNVNQPTAVTVTLTSTNASCSTNNGSITANASGGTGAYTYTWMPSGGNSNTVSNLGPGNYSVTVHDANNCSVTSNTTITQPPTFSINISSVSTTCNGGSDGSLTANIVGGTAPFVYAWLPAAGGNNASTGAVLPAGVYTVNVMDASTCLGTATATVNQPSIVTVSANGQSVCNGASASLTALAAGGNGGPYSYTWNTGGTGSPLSVTTTVNATYSVVATDIKGCVSAPDTAMVNVLAPLTIIVTSNDTTCAGQPASLSAIPGGGKGTYTVTWSPSGLQGNSINVSPNTTTIYTATVTDGCSTIHPSATGQVTVLLNPTLNFNPNPASGCAPVCVTFAAAASNVTGNNVVSYTWNFGDGSSANGLNASHCYNTSGNFNVYLLGITQMGCRDSVLKNSLIDVFPQPVANFNASSLITDIYDPTVYFMDLSTGGVTNWNWFFQPGTSAAQNPSHTFLSEETYPVTLIVKNTSGCSDTITRDVIIKPVFTFYAPNAFTPNFDGTNDNFLPTGDAWDLTTFNLWVFDRWGNQIYHSIDVSKGWDGSKHGEIVQEDVYVWKVELYDKFGAPHEYNGHVSLIK
jgi:gliding motility-associated-like protein